MVMVEEYVGKVGLELSVRDDKRREFYFLCEFCISFSVGWGMSEGPLEIVHLSILVLLLDHLGPGYNPREILRHTTESSLTLGQESV